MSFDKSRLICPELMMIGTCLCLQTFMQRMQNAWAFAASHLHDYQKIRPMMLALQ